MFGRAGWPNFDSSGEAILLTTKTSISKYIGLLNN